MPTPKRPANKKKSFFARLKPTTKKAKILTTVAAFAVIGGGVMVYRSFAYSLPTYQASSIYFKNEGTKKYSNRFTSDGTICVDHSFIRGYEQGPGLYYRIRIQQLINGRWNNIRESGRTGYMDQAQGPMKPNRTCWYNAFPAWYTYRLQIDPVDDGWTVSARTYGEFRYKLWGYNVNKKGDDGNTKAPNSTPAPAPVPVSNPQPSK